MRLVGQKDAPSEMAHCCAKKWVWGDKRRLSTKLFGKVAMVISYRAMQLLEKGDYT